MEITYDKIQYENRVDNMIVNLLNSAKIKLNILEQDDTTLNNLIENGNIDSFIESSNLISNFGTYVTIGKTFENEYNGKKYETVQFLDKNNNIVFDINFSQFKYNMFPIILTEGVCSYKCSNEPTSCTINNKYIDPNIFKSMKGEKLFYMYSFPCMNGFNKQKRCYRFVDNKNLTADKKREYLMQIQLFILKYFLNNPKEFTLPAVLYHNNIRLGASISNEIHSHFEALFNNKYKDLFHKKLLNAEIIAKHHNIKLYNETWISK
mgnify:CR=1 FL=1